MTGEDLLHERRAGARQAHDEDRRGIGMTGPGVLRKERGVEYFPDPLVDHFGLHRIIVLGSPPGAIAVAYSSKARA